MKRGIFCLFNNEFSTCSSVGNGHEIATVGGGELPGLVSNVTVTDMKKSAGRDISSKFADNKQCSTSVGENQFYSGD